jgi:hypothetical protein
MLAGGGQGPDSRREPSSSRPGGVRGGHAQSGRPRGGNAAPPAAADGLRDGAPVGWTRAVQPAAGGWRAVGVQGAAPAGAWALPEPAPGSLTPGSLPSGLPEHARQHQSAPPGSLTPAPLPSGLPAAALQGRSQQAAAVICFGLIHLVMPVAYMSCTGVPGGHGGAAYVRASMGDCPDPENVRPMVQVRRCIMRRPRLLQSSETTVARWQCGPWHQAACLLAGVSRWLLTRSAPGRARLTPCSHTLPPHDPPAVGHRSGTLARDGALRVHCLPHAGPLLAGGGWGDDGGCLHAAAHCHGAAADMPVRARSRQPP